MTKVKVIKNLTKNKINSKLIYKSSKIREDFKFNNKYN